MSRRRYTPSTRAYGGGTHINRLEKYVDAISLRQRGLRMMSSRIRRNFPDGAALIQKASRLISRAIDLLEEAQMEIDIASED